jgi:hypothetical protein
MTLDDAVPLNCNDGRWLVSAGTWSSNLQVEFVASVAVITPNPSESPRPYMDVFGLPLKQLDGEHFASEEIGGCKHFGVWLLTQAAEACFGTTSWPDDIRVPQVSLEFEVADVDAVGRRRRRARVRWIPVAA